MDCDRVTGSQSVGKGDGRLTDRPSSFSSYTEIFEEYCPVYLSMGMSYEQFWDGEVEMVKAYRKAAEINLERENQQAWLTGMYFYEALIDASPVLNSMSQRKKPYPYPDHCKPVTNLGKETEQQNERKRAKDAIKQWAEQWNKKFLKKQERSGNSD